MKIIVTGTRGIPDILGGVETHCQELFPRIAKMGYDITVIRRKSYVVPDNKITDYQGLKLKDIYAPRSKSMEAIVHTFLAIIWARRQNPDILHIHAIGPSILVPMARLLGMKIVVTNHGPDYNRQKWGKLAKLFLEMGEKFGTKYADKIIVISEVIHSLLKQKYRRDDFNLIYNGVNIPEISVETDYLDHLGLAKNKYIMAIGRFVEEKGFHDLICAFKTLNQNDYKLVLVGDADHETDYSLNLKLSAKKNEVILTGIITGKKLNQIFSHAALFVMPSYHEGLPIALLEAMSYNLNVVVSDIPANLEIGLDSNVYFKTGNVLDLAGRINCVLGLLSPNNYTKQLKTKYNWDNIATQTVNIYKSVMKK